MQDTLERILLVDDDTQLLDGCRRQLRRRFAIETANDPEAGLAALRDRGPFAVVVSDLNMAAKADGIGFLAQVKERAPDTVRMMLTGFPEIQTAIQAVNEGHIFRFLSKPCQPETLIAALEDGARQYQLVRTRHELLETQLRHAQKLAQLGQCAAGAAHDLNNILTVIEMGARILIEQRLDRQEVSHLLGEVEAAAKHAAQLTSQMVAFSRRHQATQFKAVSLPELMARLQGMLRHLLNLKFTLRLDIPASTPPVRADENLLLQVVMNLVTNARDAMPAGGEIEISVRSETIELARLSARRQARVGRFARLSVSDRGCGMDPTTRARIFEPFFTTKEPGKGTGLGLSILSEIVSQHDGWMEVESTLGAGSIFHVFLPEWAATVAAGAELAP